MGPRIHHPSKAASLVTGAALFSNEDVFVGARELMKQMVRKTAALIAVSLLIFGCETYTEKYAQYEGQQRNWPVSTGTTVDTHEAVPVYYSAPPRPYIVMGDLAAKFDG